MGGTGEAVEAVVEVKVGVAMKDSVVGVVVVETFRAGEVVDRGGGRRSWKRTGKG